MGFLCLIGLITIPILCLGSFMIMYTPGETTHTYGGLLGIFGFIVSIVAAVFLIACCLIQCTSAAGKYPPGVFLSVWCPWCHTEERRMDNR